MINDFQWKSMQVPAAKYDTIKGYNMGKPSPFSLRMFPPSKKPTESYKVVKSKEPDVGSYNSLTAYKKTQLNKVDETVFIEKQKKNNFLDQIQKAKKFVPAPGHYKDLDKAYKRISTSPISIRTKRH